MEAGEGLVDRKLQYVAERRHGRPKQVEGVLCVLIPSQYAQDGSTIQHELQTLCNPDQNPNGILREWENPP